MSTPPSQAEPPSENKGTNRQQERETPTPTGGILRMQASRKRETLRSRRAPGLRAYLLFYQIQCDSRHQTNALLHAKPAETGETMKSINRALNMRTSAVKTRTKSGDEAHRHVTASLALQCPHCPCQGCMTVEQRRARRRKKKGLREVNGFLSSRVTQS